MSELTQEQYEGLPDYVKGDYQEFDGVYKHAGMMKLKGSLNDLDSKYKGEVSTLNERLDGFEEAKKAEIEEARKQALADAKSAKDVEEIEKLHQEQMADLEARVAERVRGEVTQEFKAQSAQKDANALAAKLAAQLGVDDDARQDLQSLIGLRIKPSESGEIVFYNRDGSASAMSEQEFVADVKARHKHLVKAEVPTNGGGLANGSKGKGGAKPSGDKKISDMTMSEKIAYFESKGIT